MRFHSNSRLAAGALLLTGMWMIAPAASAAPARSAQHRQAGIAVDHAGGNGVRRADPGDKTTGVNPMFEGKDKANLKPNAGASASQYKDPEDMTTRYRPGNNKTTIHSLAVDHAGGNGVRRMDGGQNASGPAAESGISSGSSATARTKKHLAGVKYQDRTSEGGGNNPRGLAVNEQGSTKQGGSSAPARHRH